MGFATPEVGIYKRKVLRKKKENTLRKRKKRFKKKRKNLDHAIDQENIKY